MPNYARNKQQKEGFGKAKSPHYKLDLDDEEQFIVELPSYCRKKWVTVLLMLGYCKDLRLISDIRPPL